MIKRLYLANGQLLEPLDIASEDIAVDANTAALLTANINIGDYCYLTLVSQDKLEVVKISRDNSGLHVDRAQDGTVRQGFPLGTRIIYKLTSAEIRAAVVISTFTMYADGTGKATVSHTNNKWAVGLPEIEAITLGGITTYTEDNSLVIQDKSEMFGCCDGSLTGAPRIPGPIFYLTSMIYGMESFDRITPSPKDNNGNNIPPLDISHSPWNILQQPLGSERYFQRLMGVNDWNMFGRAGGFSAFERYVSPTIKVNDWVASGSVGGFSGHDGYFQPIMYPLIMTLYGSAVAYNNGLEKYINRQITPLNWTTT